MSQMSWLSYLVDTENKEELEKFLKDKFYLKEKI